MTSMYRTSGALTNPVTDLQAARAYLDEPMEDFVKFHHEDLAEVVFTARWDLTSEDAWQVTIVTTRLLTDDESARLSQWISGQNSDGLGEGFEQQVFAEHGYRNRWGDWEQEEDDDEDDEDDEGNIVAASFDWQDNPCTLELADRPWGDTIDWLEATR